MDKEAIGEWSFRIATWLVAAIGVGFLAWLWFFVGVTGPWVVGAVFLTIFVLTGAYGVVRVGFEE